MLNYLKWLLTSLGNSAGITEGFSMCGGEFVEVYSDPNQVGRSYCMTCFFVLILVEHKVRLFLCYIHLGQFCFLEVYNGAKVV